MCYAGLTPSPVLFEFYTQMIEENSSSTPTNGLPPSKKTASQASDDVIFHCAYNFPAVLLTLGSAAWPQLKPIYEKLVRDSRVKVRKTLAFSLFELAKILGSNLVESELIPILFHFLKDHQEVREGVLESLPEFIATLTP